MSPILLPDSSISERSHSLHHNPSSRSPSPFSSPETPKPSFPLLSRYHQTGQSDEGWKDDDNADLTGPPQARQKFRLLPRRNALLVLLSIAALMFCVLGAFIYKPNDPEPEKKTSSALPAVERANAAIVIFVDLRNDMYRHLLPTLETIEKRFNHRLGYPVVLLTETQLPSNDILNRVQWATGGKAEWGERAFETF